MGYYHNILKLFSLGLTIAILFIVIYGCQFRKYRNIERFSNEEEEPTETTSSPEKFETNKTETAKEAILEGFESKILNGLNDGSITTKEMEKLIENGTFTRKNLENIIQYIDNFKEHLRL
jgi:hypothetical protein